MNRNNQDKIEGDQFDFMIDVYNSFASTEHGRKLRNSIRYSLYKPESVSNEEWTDLLGPDVNNLEHHLVTYNLAKDFIYLCDNEVFDNSDRKLILLASLVHDWAEAIVGDKMFDKKTIEDENEEMKQLDGLIKDAAHRHKNIGLTEIDFKKSIEIVKDRNSKTGKAFNAIERIGYLLTGLRSFRKSEEILNNQKLVEGLRWLTHNVFLNQIPALLEYQGIYPMVNNYLVNYKNDISEAFELLQDGIFEKYDQEEMEVKRNKFESAKEKWFEYAV